MRWLWMVALISLAGCAPKRPATVDEINHKPHRSQAKSNDRHHRNKSKPKTHRVVRGDSLYSIGFRYQVDYKTLAAINDIKPPYRIYPNQILQLTGEPKKVYFRPEPSTTTTQVKPLQTNPPIVAKSESTQTSKPPTKTTTRPTDQPANPAKVNQPVTQKPTTQPVVSNKPAPKKPVVVNTPNNTNLKWLWPTQGKIRTTFLASNPARKGISIGGKEGQDVKAAEAGVVVYSGNGLLGYGELVIIKHNDTYLSAYGHNQRIKVKEGQTVSRGQVIAALGSSGTNVDNLHFEIRKNGKPVNPLNYVKP